MQAVSGWHNGRQIIVPTLVAAPDDMTLARPIQARGLIDTGATITGISRDIVDRLQLVPEGKRMITNTHGQARANQHRFRLGFLADAQTSFGLGAVAQPFLLEGLLFGIDLTPAESFDILIGMDVLVRANIRIGRDRSYSLSF